MAKSLKGALNALRNVLIFDIRYRWIKRGRNVHCQWNVLFWSPRRHIVLGDDVGIGPGCIFFADTEIGNKVLIGPYSAFLNSDDHRIDVVGKAIWDSGRGDRHSLKVSDDVWIGHGAIILTPVCVGRGAVVAAGSVVTKDVPPYAIVAGNPARVLRMRFTPEQIIEHERLLQQAEGRSSKNDVRV
jgi:acetyltransferase-like isoleucine patch superfamily enzyme